MPGEILVEVDLKSLLARFAPPDKGHRFNYRLQLGDNVAQLLAELALPAKSVGLVAVNGRKVGPDHLLADGDRVQILPPFLAGG